jgi:hypothetical protein
MMQKNPEKIKPTVKGLKNEIFFQNIQVKVVFENFSIILPNLWTVGLGRVFRYRFPLIYISRFE